MVSRPRKDLPKLAPKDWPILEVWDKYETIAMHFNDLIIKLRTQALAGVAALSTLVTLFAKSDAASPGIWGIAEFIFLGLALAWVAIWIIDFSYYNRLLTGAVIAIINLENKSKTSSYVRHIEMSTLIEGAVAGDFKRLNFWRYIKLSWGRWAFYIIVFLALMVGLIYSASEQSKPRVPELLNSATQPTKIPATKQ